MENLSLILANKKIAVKLATALAVTLSLSASLTLVAAETPAAATGPVTSSPATAADSGKVVAQADATNGHGSDYIFTPNEQRRDPFYSLLDVLAAEQKIKLLQESKAADKAVIEDTGLKNMPVSAADAHPTQIALDKARYYADRAEFELLNSNWAGAISESENGLKLLKSAEVAPQFVEQINTLNLLLNGFRTTAKDAQLNEAAEAKFNALKLEVQGIMWSADKRSVAIISGVAYYVQDKIGEGSDAVTIVNIDPNRVDFMINHQRKRFEFKRYIDIGKGRP